MLVGTLFGSAPLSAAADEACLSLTALAASARDVPSGNAQLCVSSGSASSMIGRRCLPTDIAVFKLDLGCLT